MPSNKIGKLRAGQGLRRIQGQRMGGWRDQDAKDNFEVGRELQPETYSSPGEPARSSRWGGSGKHGK